MAESGAQASYDHIDQALGDGYFYLLSFGFYEHLIIQSLEVFTKN